MARKLVLWLSLSFIVSMASSLSLDANPDSPEQSNIAESLLDKDVNRSIEPRGLSSDTDLDALSPAQIARMMKQKAIQGSVISPETHSEPANSPRPTITQANNATTHDNISHATNVVIQRFSTPQRILQQTSTSTLTALSRARPATKPGFKHTRLVLGALAVVFLIICISLLVCCCGCALLAAKIKRVPRRSAAYAEHQSSNQRGKETFDVEMQPVESFERAFMWAQTSHRDAVPDGREATVERRDDESMDLLSVDARRGPLTSAPPAYSASGVSRKPVPSRFVNQ